MVRTGPLSFPDFTVDPYGMSFAMVDTCVRGVGRQQGPVNLTAVMGSGCSVRNWREYPLLGKACVIFLLYLALSSYQVQFLKTLRCCEWATACLVASVCPLSL